MAMLDLGVIEESHSAWSSPIVLIPKPDGSIRFCNDFRKLNAVSKFDAYPMPRVDELIDRLGKARYITTLDLTKGYWQIPLAEAAREKTAFATPEGLFQYVYMPFGLHGAPATFQRLMDRVLRPHRQYASAYLDDIVIYSMDWETHLQKVQAVIDDLRDAGLTANPKKCHIGLEEARYLGYVIGRGVVKPQIDKIQAIQGWPQPVNKKQVQAFLGIAGYYRRFIPNFAAMATPLTDLTKGKGSVMVKWTSAAEEAFHSLKRALCSQPVLVTPDFSSEFVVQTDASDTGVGAVLSQVRDGVEHPVLYLSRKLNVHEQSNISEKVTNQRVKLLLLSHKPQQKPLDKEAASRGRIQTRSLCGCSPAPGTLPRTQDTGRSHSSAENMNDMISGQLRAYFLRAKLTFLMLPLLCRFVLLIIRYCILMQCRGYQKKSGDFECGDTKYGMSLATADNDSENHPVPTNRVYEIAMVAVAGGIMLMCGLIFIVLVLKSLADSFSLYQEARPDWPSSNSGKYQMGRSSHWLHRCDFVNEVLEDQEQVAEVLEAQKQVAELEDQKQVAEGLEDQEHLTEVLGDKEHVAEVLGDQEHVAEVLEYQEQVAEVLEDQKQVAEVLENQKKVAEVLEDQKQVAEVLEDQEQAAEVLEDQEHLTEVLGDKEHVAEVLGDQEYVAEVLEYQEQVAEVWEDQEQVAEVLEDQEQVAEVLEDQEHVAKVMEDQEQVAEVLEDQEQVAEVLKDQETCCSGPGRSGTEVLEDQEQVAEVLEDQKQVADVLEDQKQVAEVLEVQEQVAEGLEDQEHLTEVLGDKEHVAEVLGDQEHVAEVLEYQEQVAEVLEDQKQVAEVLKDQKEVAEVLEDQEQVAEGLEDQEHLTEVLGDQEHVAEVLRWSAGGVAYNNYTEESTVSNINLNRTTNDKISTADHQGPAYINYINEKGKPPTEIPIGNVKLSRDALLYISLITCMNLPDDISTEENL
ncbi:unnamed protein product [Ranitomeya imitator]|uniref:ribonuclease H n=1 Tax=Ranitomeya imitator TaxID=111125 RepID=A0ABN9KUK1_9NEOB|nr:unnamed protein product [Ranitomeya imitator]